MSIWDSNWLNEVRSSYVAWGVVLTQPRNAMRTRPSAKLPAEHVLHHGNLALIAAVVEATSTWLLAAGLSLIR